MRNKWKIAFWCCFATLIIVSGLAFYAILDQGISLTYLRDSHDKTTQDLNKLSAIINDSTRSKQAIKRILAKEHYLDEEDMLGDTIELYEKALIFSNNKLIKVQGRTP